MGRDASVRAEPAVTDRPAPRLEKRSLTLAGHRTSVALEPEFWSALSAIAAKRGQSTLQIITLVDAERTSEQNLAAALRLFTLRSARF